MAVKFKIKPSDLMPSSQGFLGLSKKDAVSFEKAKAVVVPFGLESSVSYGGGTKHGPQAMIKASHQVELFDEHFWCEPFRKIGIATLKEPKIGKNVKQEIENLASRVQAVLDAKKFPITFGGEHSISAGTIIPFAKKYKNLAVLHFDAHADLRDGYAGDHYSHAAALRRVLDHKEVTTLISVGIRNISASEIPFLEANKKRITIHWGKDRKNYDYKKIVAPLKGRDVYLTFDVDGFDASLMPATGTPEPGGIFWNDAMGIIGEAAKICNIVGADVNELAPRKELHSADFLCAKLAYKILSFAFLGKNKTK
jgi:agmatinase